MTLKYEILKRLVKAANIKKQWTGMPTQALLDNRRRASHLLILSLLTSV